MALVIPTYTINCFLLPGTWELNNKILMGSKKKRKENLLDQQEKDVWIKVQIFN